MVGVAMAPLIGRSIDRLVPWSATLVATLALLATFALQTAAVGLNVAVVVLVTALVASARAQPETCIFTSSGKVVCPPDIGKKR